MKLDLVNSTVVIAARQFNPSIVREHWLVQNGIVAPEDLQRGCVFTDMLVNVRSREFNLLVAPEQCQFVPRVGLDEQQQVVSQKVGTIIRTLPHTPFTALGLNFHWHLVPEHVAVEVLSRRLFFVPGSPLHSALDAKDALFGGYVSRDVLGFRMKLDVKPMLQAQEGQERHLLQFAFNFHLDLPEDPEERIAAIENAFGRWNDARAESQRISDAAATGESDE